jgi:hypothetical protein
MLRSQPLFIWSETSRESLLTCPVLNTEIWIDAPFPEDTACILHHTTVIRSNTISVGIIHNLGIGVSIMVRTLLSNLILLSCFLVSTEAWTQSPKNRGIATMMKKHLATAAIAATCCLSQPCFALDPMVYNHDYNDPFHPLCMRHVQVEGNTFHYSGTGVGPKDDRILRGCTPKEIKEYGLRNGAFEGVILEDGKISAGDGVHEGIWEPANSVTTTLGYEDIDGIRWNDGNKWTVKTKSLGTQVGEFIFLAYVGVSMLAGVKGVVDVAKRKSEENNI